MTTLRTYNNYTPEYKFYKEMHINQTLDFVKNKYKKYSNLDNTRISIKTALELMDEFIDPSDPDLHEPNSIHAYQTAEAIRKDNPENKELQIIGLIHDLGKVLFSFGEPDWCVVGDTYVVGCEFPKSIVYYDTLKENKESEFNKYAGIGTDAGTSNGIYKPKCGLENLYITFGHDMYLYEVLRQNTNHKISKKGMNIIRYHSFYPWHKEGAYRQFMNEEDDKTLEDVLHFNKYDLYSKADVAFTLTDEIKQYYDNLLDEFFHGELQW